ncbi:MAG TPA: hypothetical protein VIP51_05700 [Eoetvoesiella sp.]
MKNATAALALIASGVGIGVCSGHLKPIATLQNLKVIPLIEPSITRDFAMYSLRSSEKSPIVETHKALLQEHFSQFGQDCVEDHLWR